MGKRLTIEEIKGLKFELFLEELLKKKDVQSICRNVEFYKSRYCFRQVDIIYKYVHHGKTLNYALEAKYTSTGRIKYFLREKITRNTPNGKITLDNVVDQVCERQSFIDFDVSVLVTNGYFDEIIHEEGRKRNIILLEKVDLEKICSDLGYKEEVDILIKKVKLNKKSYKKYKVNLYK